MEIIKHCHLCQSKKSRLLFEQTDLFHKTSQRFSIRQCLSCGLVFLSPRSTVDELMNFYPESYIAYTQPLQKEKSLVSKLNRRYGLQKRIKFVEQFLKHGRILDVGCATGAFIAEIQNSAQACWELYGVEPNPYAAELARQTNQAKIFTGMLENAHYPCHHFDVITMWDVLEHVFQPKDTLQEVKRILKPDGVLIFSLPNLDSWDAAIFKNYWVGYDVPRHMHVFSMKNLKALLDMSGFKIIQTKCVAGSYFYFISSIMFLLRAKGSAPWLEQFVWRIHQFMLLRLLAAPYFMLSDMLRKSTTITVACQHKSE